jgi:hypothetical protein
VLRAQFQEPTAEELKMTEDPKAPGAAAVYLYHEETSDDYNGFHSYYERIKVLTEKGKELATVRLPYFPGDNEVTKVEGRTIHADGTVIPLTAKPDDLVEFKTKEYQENSIVFTLPGVEVGSILEYRYRYSGFDFGPTWWIQQPYFVHKAHYCYIAGQNFVNGRGQVLGSLFWTTRGIPNQSIIEGSHRRFTLDLADIPPFPNDDWMPPPSMFRWNVKFYYTYATSAASFWDAEGKRLAQEVEGFIHPNREQKATVADIVAPTDTEEQKARKIYEAVMKLDNTDFSRRKSEAERKKDKLKEINKAEDVWKQRSGSGDEIALLYVALARAAGLQAWPMKVVDRSRAIFDLNYLSVRQLDDYIAGVELDGKKVYLDPGQNMCPFGSLHWKHTFAGGLRLTEKGAVFETTPGVTYKDSIVKRVASLDLDEAGNVKGSVRFVMAGPSALFWRQLALENDEEEVKKQFNESMRAYLPEGVQADFDHFAGLEDPNVNLVGIANVSGSTGSATGKHFFLPGLFFESRAKHPFVAKERRIIPIDVHYPELMQDEATYHLPAGFKVESLPQDANASWPDHALFNVQSNAKNGSVIVFRSLAYNFTVLDPNEYPDLHDFYLKVAAADQQQLVLTRAPVTKGN